MRYRAHTMSQGGETKSPDPDTGTPEEKASARSNFWFSTMEHNQVNNGNKAKMVLNDDDIKQLTTLQVITESRNESPEGNNETGSGTWFVVAICEKDGRTIKKLDNGQSLSWLSHSNWFKTSDNGYAWCRGRMFTKDDEMFKHLKANLSTASVIHEYLNNKVKKPLSIAVFGQPCAGKSFGVKEVIKAVLNKDKGWEPIEANLSQFQQYSDLVRVFDKVRDTLMKGETPVVLFDEFDSAFGQNALGWLKYFLAPMQDGEFLDSGFVRPLGRAIFIFIGGTSSTFKEFKYGTEAKANDVEAAEKTALDKVAAEKKAVGNAAVQKATDERKGAEKKLRDLVAGILTDDDKKAKKPDFVSRLSAHINVKGPNESDDADVMFVMRRAMLLQGQLGKHFKAQVKDIHVDETVLNALLKHKHFPNGTRSIELILQSSTISGGRRFESSDLPSAEQLTMHVGDVAAFHALIDEPIEMAPVRPVDIDLYNKLMWARLEKDID